MENSVFETLDTPVTPGKLQAYLDGVVSVETTHGTVKFLRELDGKKEELVINYAPETVRLGQTDKARKARADKGYLNNVQVIKSFTYDNGKVLEKEIRPTLDKTGKAQIVLLNSRTYVNALIRAAHDLAEKALSDDDTPVIPAGYQYNHRLAGGLGLGEEFGPDAGEFVPNTQNILHWFWVNKVNRELGIKVKLPSYHEAAYSLFGKDPKKGQNITKEDILRLGYINRGDYLEIPDQDTYRWCVSIYIAEEKLKIAPLFWNTRFAEVFGAHGSIPWEFDTLKEAEAFAESFGYSCWKQEFEIR